MKREQRDIQPMLQIEISSSKRPRYTLMAKRYIYIIQIAYRTHSEEFMKGA